jgi:energy-coupling factor transporter ATP-binding protein EcfA2
MSSGRITSLRLTAFKSYQDVELPLAPLNVLIGRNGSGKSNALDALEILSRLAQGEEVRDALDGDRRRESGPVRGGIEGCAPFGADEFEIGATVEGDDGFYVELDVRVRVKPRVQIVYERLGQYIGSRCYELLVTDESDPNRSDVWASVWNGKRGPSPSMAFRSSHLLTSQLLLRLSGEGQREQRLLGVASRVLGVLGGVFHLDPVPHLMRQYVPEQDYVLRRTAENISAAVARLKHDDPASFAKLVSIIKDLPEHEVRAVDIGKGPYGDVMVALKERKGRSSVTVPARQMSDGMLRMLAIATALLSGGGGLDLDRSSLAEAPALMLVVEELENGLHPSQAARVLDLVKESSAERGFQVVVTTHSPALLNALSGDDHQGVLLIDRDRRSGLSRARRLVDVPGYLGVMASRRLGDAISEADLTARLDEEPGYGDINRLLGIG